MKYKELYKELAHLLDDLGCAVCDHDFWGYCYQAKKIKGFIIIRPDMSFKRKFFTLAHEAGHLFYFGKDNKFNWSKKPKTEVEANTFALQILKLSDIDPYEYSKIYEKAKKKSKNRKKSWFEI
jgi:Zn-dependent peptidase ImmA (M78 family)